MNGKLALWLGKPNALWIRELKQASRSGRTQWILLVLVLAITCLLAAIGGFAAQYTAPEKVGQTLYQTFFSVAMGVVTYGGSGIAALAISSERAGRTFEAIQLTGISPKEVARGKFFASYSAITLYIVGLAPIAALPFLFGGVDAIEVVLGFVFLLLYAAIVVAFGLAISSSLKTPTGALIVTLVLASSVGPMLYGFVGFTASIAISSMFGGVTLGMPIWIPLTLVRADFGAPYVLFLVAAPLLALGLPAWFFYEVTLANLSDETDDRSTRLKVWYAITTVLVFLWAASVTLWASTLTAGSGTTALEVAVPLCFALLIFHIAFGIFLLAGEQAYPSRRLRTLWERTGAGAITRFWGPSLPKTGFVQILFGIGALSLFALLSAVLLRSSRHMLTITAASFYLITFTLFMLGLVVWLGARTRSSAATRLVAAGIAAFLALAPWVLVAILGISHMSGGDRYTAFAAPSPFFVFALNSGSTAEREQFAVISVITSGVYALLGIVLFALGATASRKKYDQTIEVEQTLERALLAEDHAREALSTAP
jgi:hypothetical protein